jgi:surface antigen
MKSGIGRTLVWGLLFTVGLIGAERRATAGNCALFARAETGVSLFGAAGGWWDQSAGLYERGHLPEVGSILVFKRTGFIPSGHVAVVSKVVGPGQVLVDQSNWYHGRVTRDTPVIDTSPDHDWSQVAVMNIGTGEFGRDSPTYGFVYPETGSPALLAMRAAGRLDPSLGASRAAYEPTARSALFHFAVAENGWRSETRYHKPAGAGSGERHSRRRDRRRWGAAAGEHRSEHRSTAHASHTRSAHNTSGAPRSAAHANHSSRAGHAPTHASRADRHSV